MAAVTQYIDFIRWACICRVCTKHEHKRNKKYTQDFFQIVLSVAYIGGGLLSLCVGKKSTTIYFTVVDDNEKTPKVLSVVGGSRQFESKLCVYFDGRMPTLFTSPQPNGWRFFA